MVHGTGRGAPFLSRLCVSHLCESFLRKNFPDIAEKQRNGSDNGADICDRFRIVNAHNAEEMRQNERERDEEQSLPRRRNDACPQRHGNVLKQHIAHNDKAGDWERDALQPQRQRTDADNLGIIAPKYRNDLRCKSKAEHCERQQNQRGGSDAEVKAPRHTVVLRATYARRN